jgi:hypothetical protein
MEMENNNVQPVFSTDEERKNRSILNLKEQSDLHGAKK